MASVYIKAAPEILCAESSMGGDRTNLPDVISKRKAESERRGVGQIRLKICGNISGILFCFVIPRRSRNRQICLKIGAKIAVSFGHRTWPEKRTALI
jgi:hypothetical protein